MKKCYLLKVYAKILVMTLATLWLLGCQNLMMKTEDLNEQRPTIELDMHTSMGVISIELYPRQAPKTVSNFLRYVDSGAFNGGQFYRVVRHDNDNGQPKITVIQGDVKDSQQQWPPIALETTEQTGISHRDGTLSMARLGPDTATSTLFICIDDQPSLDFAGQRNKDGQGFAAFGRVTKGMEVVRAINQLNQTKQNEDPYMKGQMLLHPVLIESLTRR